MNPGITDNPPQPTESKLKHKKVFKVPLLIVFVLLSSLLFKFTINVKSALQMSPVTMLPDSNKFLIGSMQSYSDNLTNYDGGGFNVIHSYVGTEFDTLISRHVPYSWVTGEHLFEDVPKTDIRRIIDNIYINHNESRFIWQRPKIEWLALGQSSVYQAEDISLSEDYWFYSFNTSIGENLPDEGWNNGDTVLHCSVLSLNSGIVLARLKANSEQCRRIVGAKEINHWSGDSECKWLIKPKIRIDSVFANNPQNLNALVCRIDVKNDSGVIFKSVVLRVRNFLVDPPGTYSGKYIEEFRYSTGDSMLSYKGDWGTNWGFSARGTCETDFYLANHSDIQVYWYDNCDMWIDYVKVENDVADLLLKGKYDNWIEDEVDAVNNGRNVYTFYTELFEFNNIPCIAYVNKKLQTLSGGKFGFMADQLNYYNLHMSWGDKASIVTPEKLKRMYFDVTEAKQVFMGDPYPLTASQPRRCNTGGCDQHCKIPSTLPNTKGDEILADTVSPASYDSWLQNVLDTTCTWFEFGALTDTCRPLKLHGAFSYLMKNGNGISRVCDVPFIAMLQAHQWVSENEVDREPTVEEQNMMTNVAVSYGAKGIIFWWFPSIGDPVTNPCNYSLGLVNTDLNIRMKNVYGQNKWAQLTGIVSRLKNWGPVLMSFDNTQTNSYIYRLEYSSCLSDTYFSDVKTFPPIAKLSSTPASVADDVAHTYIQASVFKKESEPNISYFMIVNRRCSPYREIINADGGRRDVKIKFDNNTDWGTWRIINLENGSIVTTFNRNASTYVDLGWFMPGEGRLYRLEPVE